MDLNARRTAWLVLVGVVSAIAWASNLSSGAPPKNAVYMYSTAGSELILFAIILTAVLTIARGLPFRQAFALRAPRSWGRAVALGIAVLIAIVIANAVTDPLLHPGREQGLTPTHWQPAHAGAFALNLVALGLAGPIVEELTFRGLGFTLFQQFGQTAVVLFIGVAFALWHGLVDAIPVLFVFGAGLAYLRSQTDSVYPGMILHAGFNTITLLLAVTV